MDVGELKIVLDRFRAMYEASGAAAQARDIASVIEALDGFEKLSVDDCVTRMQELLAQPAAESSAQVNEIVVRRYANQLNDAGLDRGAFDQALADMKADRSVKKRELDAIAFAYIGGREKQASKKAGFAALEDKFIERLRSKGKRDLIGKVTPW